MDKPAKKPIVSTVPMEHRERSAPGFKVLFDSPIKSNRPMTVYKERIINPEDGELIEVLWWATEQGDEVGREAIKKPNAMDPDDKTLLGYNYTILASPEEIEKVKKMAWGRTQFASKDGERRYLIPKDSF